MSGGLFGNGASRGGDASAAFSSMSINDQRDHPGAPGRGAPAPPSGAGGHRGAPSPGLRRAMSMPKDFPRLLDLSAEELHELLTDKASFARFLHGTEGALEARAFTRDLRLEIEGMARANIEVAEEAEDLRSQISVIRAVDLQPVREGYEAVKKRADALVGKYDANAALARLKARCERLNEECEEMDEAFLEGKVTAEEFLERYVKKREKYHQDAIRASIVEQNLPSATRGGGMGTGGQRAPPPPPPARAAPGAGYVRAGALPRF